MDIFFENGIWMIDDGSGNPVPLSEVEPLLGQRLAGYTKETLDATTLAIIEAEIDGYKIVERGIGGFAGIGQQPGVVVTDLDGEKHDFSTRLEAAAFLNAKRKETAVLLGTDKKTQASIDSQLAAAFERAKKTRDYSEYDALKQAEKGKAGGFATKLEAMVFAIENGLVDETFNLVGYDLILNPSTNRFELKAKAAATPPSTQDITDAALAKVANSTTQEEYDKNLAEYNALLEIKKGLQPQQTLKQLEDGSTWVVSDSGDGNKIPLRKVMDAPEEPAQKATIITGAELGLTGPDATRQYLKQPNGFVSELPEDTPPTYNQEWLRLFNEGDQAGADALFDSWNRMTPNQKVIAQQNDQQIQMQALRLGLDIAQSPGDYLAYIQMTRGPNEPPMGTPGVRAVPLSTPIQDAANGTLGQRNGDTQQAIGAGTQAMDAYQTRLDAQRNQRGADGLTLEERIRRKGGLQGPTGENINLPLAGIGGLPAGPVQPTPPLAEIGGLPADSREDIIRRYQGYVASGLMNQQDADRMLADTLAQNGAQGVPPLAGIGTDRGRPPGAVPGPYAPGEGQPSYGAVGDLPFTPGNYGIAPTNAYLPSAEEQAASLAGIGTNSGGQSIMNQTPGGQGNGRLGTNQGMGGGASNAIALRPIPNPNPGDGAKGRYVPSGNGQAWQPYIMTDADYAQGWGRSPGGGYTLNGQSLQTRITRDGFSGKIEVFVPGSGWQTPPSNVRDTSGDTRNPFDQGQSGGASLAGLGGQTSSNVNALAGLGQGAGVKGIMNQTPVAPGAQGQTYFGNPYGKAAGIPSIDMSGVNPNWVKSSSGGQMSGESNGDYWARIGQTPPTNTTSAPLNTATGGDLPDPTGNPNMIGVKDRTGKVHWVNRNDQSSIDWARNQGGMAAQASAVPQGTSGQLQDGSGGQSLATVGTGQLPANQTGFDLGTALAPILNPTREPHSLANTTGVGFQSQQQQNMLTPTERKLRMGLVGLSGVPQEDYQYQERLNSGLWSPDAYGGLAPVTQSLSRIKSRATVARGY